MNDTRRCFWGFLLGLVVGLSFVAAACQFTNQSWRDELLSQGLYEWRIDSITGEREFVPVEDISSKENQ